ncbi:MAG: SDR family NAD(P)-dependent oxidoreductase [Nitrospirae bacterium]|nr:SDR family NAD(P)-dependent oxidoreductase [Nitrospirota bacterium]
MLPVAVVTGASRGLGRETALALGESGYCVGVNYLKSETEAKDVAGQIGEKAILLQGDVGDSRQVKAIADKIHKKWGRIDALINNAGITKDDLMIKMHEKDWEEVLRINLKGCFNAIRMFTPVMIKSGGGHIVNISSYSGLKGKKGQTAYSASKGAILGLTYAAAKELAEYNIMVNALAPGYMQTDMGKSAEKAMEMAKEESISGMLSDPKEVARFILYLLQNKNMTGQVFCLESRIV